VAEEIITVKEANLSPEATHIALGDLLRYEEILVKVVHLVKSATSLAVGATTQLTSIKFHVGSGEYTWAMGSLKREK
jgi:hypothetical protein